MSLGSELESALQTLIHAITIFPGIKIILRSQINQDQYDLELFIYCIKIPARSQRRSVYLSNQLENLLTNLVLKEHRTLHWGIMDSFQLCRVETRLIYFTIHELNTEINESLADHNLDRIDAESYPTTRLAMLSTAELLYDPSNLFPALHDRIKIYPPELKHLLFQYHLKGLEDLDDFDIATTNRDVAFFHAALDKGLNHLFQALFALNEMYYSNRKLSSEIIRSFPLKPRMCQERIQKIIQLGASETTLSIAILEWNALISELKQIGVN